MARKPNKRRAGKWKSAITKLTKEFQRTLGTSKGDRAVKKLAKAHENYYNAIGAK